MKDPTSDNKENEHQQQRNGSMPPPSPASTEQNKKHSTHKQEKAILHEFEGHVKEVKSQLTEQLKAFGERTETQVAVLQELEEFFRRRGELEAEHAKQLDKLAKGIMQRHKAEKNRRDAWTQHTACTTWQQMVDDAKEEAAQRQALADLYQKVFTASISSRCDDLIRISKKCREIGVLSHSEINRVLTELHTAMKTYQLCHSELNGVEKKYRVADDEKRRYEEVNPGKFATARKYKNICKYLNRRAEKFELVRCKCTKARNEYLMCVKAANAALHRFFAEDLSYLVDCMDLGMDFWIKSLLEQVIDVRKRLTAREMNALAELGTLRSSFDSKADKQRFFEAHHATFMLPKQFEFRPQLGDSIASVSAEKSLAMELGQRQKQIEIRLEGLRFESDEVWKSLEASERQLHQLYTETQEDMSKWRSDVLVTYQYYLKKFEYFLLNGNLIERLTARSRLISEAVARENGQQHRDSIISCEDRTRKKTKRIGQAPDLSKPRPKLFGGSLDEYVEMSEEPIPLVVTSAIGYLSRFSLRNQGLFRVSGSQSEINRFKEAYEKGEDAFSELIDGSETNSVAGALKLYLRELREPLFPIFLFDQFVDCAKAETPGEFIRRTNELIYKLPISHILLLRFLFGFLSHLCEFADENMMEPHNLAICFGPTLLPIPEGKDQVVYHNYVNELVRNLIIHSAEVFPAELDGPIYDKFAIDTEPEHIGYMDDGDVLSDDEEAPGTRNGTVGTSSGDQMLDSTYDMSVSTENDGPVIPRETTHSTIQQPMSPRIESQPSISSRSSNRSAIDEYLRRMSEETSPILKTDMPHRIANELNAKFAARESRDCERQQQATISPPRPIWEQDRPASHTSILSQNSNTSSSRTRIPVVTSLRDQLHHVRREFNGRDDGKVYPISETLPSSKRLSLHEGNVLDARGTLPREQSETRSQICDYTSRLATTTTGSLRDELNSIFNEHLSHQQSSLADAPDVVMSARRFASEAHTRSISPQLDELAAMLKATSVE